MRKDKIRKASGLIVTAALVAGLIGCMSLEDKYNIYQTAKRDILTQNGWYPYQGDDSYGKDTSEDKPVASDTEEPRTTEAIADAETEERTEDTTENRTEDNTQESGTTESDGYGDTEEIYASDLRYKAGLYHTTRTTWTAPTVCNDIYDVANAVDSYVLAGCRDNLKLYINGIPDSDIKNMNQYMTQSFGWGDQYLSGRDSGGDYIAVDLKYEDSYYVYMYIVYGVPIPEDNSRALEIYSFLQNVIYAKADLTKLDDFYTERFYHDIVTLAGEYNDAAAASIVNGQATTEAYGNAFTVYGTLIEGSCVCEGYARTLDLLFRLSGMGAYYATGYAKDNASDTFQNANDDNGHAWNIVSVDGQWYQLDATWNDDDEAKRLLGIDYYYVYFNVSDEVAGAERTWDTNLYPRCNSMDMNFYNATGKYMSSHSEFESYLNNDSDEEAVYDIAVADYNGSTYSDSDILLEDQITDDYTVLFVNR